MPDKSPHSHHAKKAPAKTLKQKRAEKHAKHHDPSLDMNSASDAIHKTDK
ncbi:MAG TPA: hypothetical protein VIP54_09050 [Microterricola sp.]|jgi:hypothetical protein|nr:hypothetical protein [Leifsonia sp. Root4]